jgi:hypothetical protein
MAGLTMDVSPIVRALKRVAVGRREAAQGAARALARRMEGSARAACPWQDRTGRARRSILSSAEATPRGLRIALSMDAPYAAALEFSRGGRFSVLRPTIRRFTPDFLRAAGRVGGA